METAIELKGISKTYKGEARAAVCDVSLKVKRGSIITLLGPSGCGKTTTLRLIAGFERPESGEINIGGKLMAGDNTWVSPEKRKIGMVFQDYALFPHLNVEENIGFGYRGKDKKQRVQEVLEMVNLQGFENKGVHHLSGGQQQRVALARALAKRPEVVLLDEPFSNLDTNLKQTMRNEVKRILKKANATGILVSHDQKDALAISDEIVVMKDGIIQQKGSPKKIYQFPRNAFVAGFVGESNMMEGVVEPGKRWIATDIGRIPCNQYHILTEGEEVLLSLRPSGFEIAEEGDIKGVVESLSYVGEYLEARVAVVNQKKKKISLLVYLHPNEILKQGDPLNLRVSPNFVSVVKS
ncbi:ABC transporter ATP-binding protein [Isachenkonia alkalipeptolytica]|uniref:ABC-type quaternary amine transporter n=1 Tax=Isachenkonia alkalipeptolytica TaxID=2565777 RepID=A0AA43XK05_9CLOT|nr:ABC transporter ATP-binding protein [Isachenkonia alkalipeptolytica]NBG88057.1 ABC transporter ATP-binding protein [Isachenkonia alkalipeptolytica]